MAGSRDCCEGCVAPKRYIGCHGKCPEYDEPARKKEWAKRENGINTIAPYYAFKSDMVERTKKWVATRK